MENNGNRNDNVKSIIPRGLRCPCVRLERKEAKEQTGESQFESEGSQISNSFGPALA